MASVISLVIMGADLKHKMVAYKQKKKLLGFPGFIKH